MSIFAQLTDEIGLTFLAGAYGTIFPRPRILSRVNARLCVRQDIEREGAATVNDASSSRAHPYHYADVIIVAAPNLSVAKYSKIYGYQLLALAVDYFIRNISLSVTIGLFSHII